MSITFSKDQWVKKLDQKPNYRYLNSSLDKMWLRITTNEYITQRILLTNANDQRLYKIALIQITDWPAVSYVTYQDIQSQGYGNNVWDWLTHWGRVTHISARSWNCGCLVTWFCYQLIAKPGNKTAAVSWPDPYASVQHINIASDDGLSPVRRQAIIWTNAAILSIRP